MINFSFEVKTVFLEAKKANGEARIVGGAVRDFILFQKPIESGDVDFAINLPVEKVAEIFTKIGAKVITKYATNIVVFNHKVFEITSTRKDENCDGRHATMIFTSSFEEDSNRRDFTFNALYMNSNGEIFDYHNGAEDLKKGIVKFIGNPYFRIEEDFLRIWRFFRFFALYGTVMDEESLKACFEKREKIYHLSKERAMAEILKLLNSSSEKVKFTIQTMIEGKILNSQDWNLNFANLPQDSFLRLLVLNFGREINLFIYTAKQKKIIKFYNENAGKIKSEKDLYFLYYTTRKEDFEIFLIIFNHLNVELKIPSTLPLLPFSRKMIFEEGFTGNQIQKEFEIRIKDFVEKMAPDV